MITFSSLKKKKKKRGALFFLNLKLFLDKYFGTYEENVRWTDEGTILVLQEVEICGPEFDKWSCRLVEEGGNQQSLSYVRGLVEKFDSERGGAL